MFISLWIHVLSAIIWLGSVIAMEFIILTTFKNGNDTSNGYILSAMSKKYARVSEISSVLILITGIYQTYANNYLDINKLINTAYGNLLLLKVILFFIFAGVGVAAGIGIAKLDNSVSKDIFDKTIKKSNILFSVDIIIGLLIIIIAIALRVNVTITF